MIVTKYSITEKQNLIMRYQTGESVTGICLQSGVPRSTFYSWLKPRKPSIIETNETVTYLEHCKLKNQAIRLESIIDVLKKVKCTATSPLKEKLTALEHLHGQYICTILDLYSRKVIAHKVSTKNSSRLINATFKHAYIERKPDDGLIFHSDRGAQCAPLQNAEKPLK